MKEFFTSEITKETSRIALLIFIVLMTVLYFYRMHTYTYINAEFTSSRPVKNKIPVYFKGYRVGKVEKITLSPDFKSTMVTIVLYPSNIKLPSNTTALLTKEKDNRREYDYINLLYPDTPAKSILEDGDRVTGFTTVDINDYLSQKAISGELDEIKDNTNKLLSSLTSTSEALFGLFDILRETVDENRPALKATTSNLAATTDNLKNFSLKLNNSIDETKIQSTISNIDKTSSSAITTGKNLESITNDIHNITSEINKTMPHISSSIAKTHSITKNIDEITKGTSKSLKKNFGGIRILFGKTITPSDCE